MTGENSYDIRPGQSSYYPLWGELWFTVFSEHLELLRWRRWMKATYPTLYCDELTVHTDNVAPNGFYPVNPEEDSSSDSNLPQGQPLDFILSDESPPPRQLIRGNSMPPPQARAHRGGKRPRSDMFAWSDHHAVSADSDEEGDEVDLKRYFKKHRVSAKQQVTSFYDTAVWRPMLKLVLRPRQ